MSPGGVLTLTWYTYMCLPLGHFFAKFGIAIGGFSSETKEPKLHKLGVFWANYCKKHPIWSKLGAFLSKMVYWWVGNLAKKWYRDNQIFEVRQAHPRTILVKEPPPRIVTLFHHRLWHRQLVIFCQGKRNPFNMVTEEREIWQYLGTLIPYVCFHYLCLRNYDQNMNIAAIYWAAIFDFGYLQEFKHLKNVSGRFLIPQNMCLDTLPAFLVCMVGKLWSNGDNFECHLGHQTAAILDFGYLQELKCCNNVYSI